MDETFTLRRQDFSLDESQLALRASIKAFLDRNCSTEVVRKAEADGWSAGLWLRMSDLRVVATAIPTDRGGDGAGLLEMAFICEETGAHVAPIPVVESTVTARLLAQVNGPEANQAVAELVAGAVGTVAIGPPGPDMRILTPYAPVATFVVSASGEKLFLSRNDHQHDGVSNLASTSMAWCTPGEGVLLAEGPDAANLLDQARREWKLLTAASLVGLGDSVNKLGVQYARERMAFGVPIGSLQSIAHPLVDAAIGVESARRLTQKACWFVDNEPEQLGVLPEMAFLHASESAERAGFTTIHTQGGFGFTLESDAQLYYRRAKGWALVAGDRRLELQCIGQHAMNPPAEARL